MKKEKTIKIPDFQVEPRRFIAYPTKLNFWSKIKNFYKIIRSKKFYVELYKISKLKPGQKIIKMDWR